MAGEELFGAAVLKSVQARLPFLGSSVPFFLQAQMRRQQLQAAGWGRGRLIYGCNKSLQVFALDGALLTASGRRQWHGVPALGK